MGGIANYRAQQKKIRENDYKGIIITEPASTS
jgi:hypothetical protein